jgi:hypothetical protein
VQIYLDTADLMKLQIKNRQAAYLPSSWLGITTHQNAVSGCTGAMALRSRICVMLVT